jgi:hypothetical protein
VNAVCLELKSNANELDNCMLRDKHEVHVQRGIKF